MSAASREVIGTLIADVQGRCPNTTTWVGSGRHRHSSGHNPSFRCALAAGHDGSCAMERQPAGPPKAIPRSRVEWSVSYGRASATPSWEWHNPDGSLFTYDDARKRAKELGGDAVVRDRVVTK